MKTTSLVFCYLFLCISTYIKSQDATANSKKIDIPYFGQISSMQLCGDPKTYCQPSSSTLWAMVENLDYNGDVGDYLGRYYSEIHDDNPCPEKRVSHDDVESFKKGSFTATVKTTKKKEFKSKVKANLAQLVRNSFDNLPESIQADLMIGLESAIEQSSQMTIDVEYKTLQLKKVVTDKLKTSCLPVLKTGQMLSTGIGIITVKGKWTSQVLNKTIAEFEANSSAFKELSAEVKVTYENARNIILAGNFEALSLIISVAYIRK